MTYTPFIISEEDWDLIVDPPPPEDYTFIYFCLIIMFIICPLILGAALIRNNAFGWENKEEIGIITIKYFYDGDDRGLGLPSLRDKCRNRYFYNCCYGFININETYKVKILDTPDAYIITKMQLLNNSYEQKCE
jgi:hypothetical protein